MPTIRVFAVAIPVTARVAAVVTPVTLMPPVTTNPAPSNVKLELSSSSPSVPAITTLLSVRSSTFALPATKIVPAVTTPEKAPLPFSKIDTPIPVPAVAPTSNAADGTLVPIPIRTGAYINKEC